VWKCKIALDLDADLDCSCYPVAGQGTTGGREGAEVPLLSLPSLPTDGVTGSAQYLVGLGKAWVATDEAAP